MKKKKLGFIFNICTICLAISAIAIGVYSLKQANVNIKGSLGFTAHGVKANIVTSITGSVAEPNATYSKTDIYQPNGTAGIIVDNDTKEITFTRYFSDNGTVNGGPAPIKMTFAITNQSLYAIKVDVVTPTLPTGVQMTADKSSIKIDKNGTGSITATFTLDSTVTDFSATKLTGFGLELSKFDYSKTDIEVHYQSTPGFLSNYYITYGTNNRNSESLAWYIIGKYVDGQLTTFSVDDLTEVTANSTYKLKEGITYAFMSNTIFKSGTTGADIIYNNNVIYNVQHSLSLDYTNVAGNDYSISTVRAYLNGKTVYTETNSESGSAGGITGTKTTPKTTGATANIFSQITLKNSDIYTLIKPRTLTSLYSKMTYGTTPADVTIPTDKTEGISGDDADAFWILSTYEYDNLLKNKPLGDKSSHVSRTPIAMTVSICSCSGSVDMVHSADGIRPVFLI